MSRLPEGENRNQVEKVWIGSMSRTLMAGEFNAGSLALRTINLGF
jgi:hypothetical protein